MFFVISQNNCKAQFSVAISYSRKLCQTEEDYQEVLDFLFKRSAITGSSMNEGNLQLSMTALAEVCLFCRSCLVWISWARPVLAPAPPAATCWCPTAPWAQRASSWCIDTGNPLLFPNIQGLCTLLHQGSRISGMLSTTAGEAAWVKQKCLLSSFSANYWSWRTGIIKLRNPTCSKCWTPPGVTPSLFLQ